MSYQLAIYRFGGLAALTRDADLALPRDKMKSLEACFLEQRDRTERRNEYKAALADILKGVRTEDPKARWAPLDEEDERRIFSMPPSIDSEFGDELDYSSHLVGLLRSERMIARIGKTSWIIRIRASVTACALEVASGIPKLWWTFEGIPHDPNPDVRPSEKDTTLFLSIVRSLEESSLDHLAAAYFGALAEVTEVSHIKSEYDVGPERLRIRFADNDDAAVTAFINALRFRELAPKYIKNATTDILSLARQGMREFTKFLKDTNTAEDPAIDPEAAEVDKEDQYAWHCRCIGSERDRPQGAHNRNCSAPRRAHCL